MSSRTRVALAILAIAVTLAIWAHTRADAPRAPKPTGTAPATRIEEDDPRWDCATMGNHQCATTPSTQGWPDA